MSGQSGEEEHLTSDAPRNSGRHPPGDALPPPPQRGTPARKGARCGAGAGSPRRHRPHPGHTGRGTPANRPRGRAAGGGTASDTRRPSQRAAPHHPHGTQLPPGMQAEGTVLGPHTRTPAPTGGGGGARHQTPLTTVAGHPPGDGPPQPPRSAAPPGHASRGDSAGPPHPHTRAHGKSGDGPTARPEGGQSGEGERLTADAPHNGPRTRTPVPTACGQRALTAPRRRAAGVARAPGLGRPSQRDRHGPRGGGAPSAHTHTRTPARGTSVRAPPSTPRRAHSTCTSHGKSAPHPLLLGTATQHRTMAEPAAPHKTRPSISDAGRSTRGHQGAGTQRRRRRPPTRGRGHLLRPGGSTRALHGKRARGTCAAGGHRVDPLPRVKTGPLHRRRLVPQTAPSAPPR